MEIISEQQTFAKLRIAPHDFAAMCESDPDEAKKYILQLQGEREHVTTRAAKPKSPKDPNDPPKKRGRQSAAVNIDEL